MTIVPPSRSLVRTLNLSLVCGGLLLACLALGIQTVLRKQEIAQEQFNRINENARLRLPRLANALWDIDPNTIRDELDGLANLEGVSWVELKTPLAQTHARSKNTPVQIQQETVLPLEVLHAENKTPLGVIALHIQNQVPWSALRHELLFTLCMHLLQITLSLLLLNVLLHRRVFSRIARLVSHLQHMRADTLNHLPPVSPQTAFRNDELDDLTRALAQAQHGLQLDIDALKQIERATFEEHTRLESEIARRSGEAVYLSGFLKQLLRLSSNFLILSPQKTDTALREALQEISTFLGLDTCFVVSMRESDRAEIRCFWRKETLPIAPLEVYFSRAREDYATSFSLLNNEKLIQLETASLAPDCLEFKLAKMLNLETLVLVRLESPEQTIGLLCGGRGIADRTLSDMECRLLNMTGNIIANLLLHHQEQLNLQKTTAALELARSELATLKQNSS